MKINFLIESRTKKSIIEYKQNTFDENGRKTEISESVAVAITVMIKAIPKLKDDIKKVNELINAIDTLQKNPNDNSANVLLKCQSIDRGVFGAINTELVSMKKHNQLTQRQQRINKANPKITDPVEYVKFLLNNIYKFFQVVYLNNFDNTAFYDQNFKEKVANIEEKIKEYRSDKNNKNKDALIVAANDLEEYIKGEIDNYLQDNPADASAPEPIKHKRQFMQLLNSYVDKNNKKTYHNQDELKKIDRIISGKNKTNTLWDKSLTGSSKVKSMQLEFAKIRELQKEVDENIGKENTRHKPNRS